LLETLGKARAEVRAQVLATVSSLPGGALLRAAATTPEHLSRFLRESLFFVAAQLGGDPFQHRW
jgi:hypothetical protein